MNKFNHWAVFVSNNSNKHLFTQALLEGKAPEPLLEFNSLKGVLFSNISLNEFIAEEEKHEHLQVAKEANRNLRSLSSGEQKKALLTYLLSRHPDFIILDNPFDNLDIAKQQALLTQITELSNKVAVIQLVSRKRDLLHFINNTISIDDEQTIIHHKDLHAYLQNTNDDYVFNGNVPAPLHEYTIENEELVRFNNVSVNYNERGIVKDINWTIKAGEFWQLVGPNGSGKTTLLSMITGDNPKGYGQDLILFGRKKGSGETVWEIKRNVGYFTPAIAEQFGRYDTVEKMIMGGFFDSIGLYKTPTDMQIKLAHDWLRLIGMYELKAETFYKLSLAQQRMALIARAMVKHPPLMILDEPIAGLDDHNARVVTALINKIASETKTAILYVSHREEQGLAPQRIFELTPSLGGSTGREIKPS